MKNVRFIIYYGADEVIITTPKCEAKMLKMCFTQGDRNLEDYDREESNDDSVGFSTRISRQW
jgi:hypothetical protein